ncbi:MAG: hypothetical protein LC750_10020 [Actinobacteria bacterium]|nr:hypothetical protein [Actinomycetota bacterium]
MASSVSVGTLVGRMKRRANRDGDNQLDDTEWKELLGEKYEELHALVSEKGSRYFETEVDVDLGDLALPDDWMSTIGVDAVLSGSTGPRRPLYGPIAVQDRTYLVGIAGGDPACAYGLEAGNLALYPTPTAGSYKHLYLPQPIDYSSASDSTAVDAINVYGRKFLIWGVAAIAAYRGSEAQDRALAEEARAKGDLEYWACQVAMTHGPRRPIVAPWAGRPPSWRWCPR